jgi:hypothetical protein
MSSEDWESRIYGRLAALPEEAGPLQRARLLAALSVGTEVIQLRGVASHLGVAADLDAALDVFAHGNSAAAITRLHQLDGRLATGPETGPDTATALRARGGTLVISGALSEHASYFEATA